MKILLFCIFFGVLQINVAHAHCGRTFSKFFPKLQKEILSSTSYKAFSRSANSNLTATELKAASELAADLALRMSSAGVELSQGSKDELIELSKFIIKNPEETDSLATKTMNNFVRDDITSLKTSKESVGIFHALPLDDIEYINVFGRSPSYDTSTNVSNELIQEMSGSKIIIKQHENASTLIDDINDFEGMPIIIAHNEEGLIKLPGFNQTLPLSTVEEACKKSNKRCIVLSCKANKHLDKVIGNECVISPTTALAISRDIAKYVESDEYRLHNDKNSLKKIESIIKTQEKNIFGHCSYAPVLVTGGIVTTGSYITFND